MHGQLWNIELKILIKEEKQICYPVFVAEDNYLGVNFSDVPWLQDFKGFHLVLVSTVTVGIVICVLRIALDFLRCRSFKSRSVLSERDDLFGLAFAVSCFLVLLGLINQENIKPNSFCVMNNDEPICKRDWPLLNYNKLEHDCFSKYGPTRTIPGRLLFQIYFDGYRKGPKYLTKNFEKI